MVHVVAGLSVYEGNSCLQCLIVSGLPFYLSVSFNSTPCPPLPSMEVPILTSLLTTNIT